MPIHHISRHLFFFLFFSKFSVSTFIPLLDYVRRAHEIEIRPSSHRRPLSVCGIDYLCSFLSNFSSCFPQAICLDIFLIFFYVLRIFSFSLTWDPMGAKISKRYSYKSQQKVFNYPYKTTFRIFEILKIENFNGFFLFVCLFVVVFFVFVIMGPNGREISKRWSSYKSQPKVF